MLLNEACREMSRVCFLAHPLALFAGLFATPSASWAEPIRVYQVGNSLSADSLPSVSAQLLSAATSESVENGFHIRSNSSIGTIWSRPLNYTGVGATFGNFLEALPQHEWDHVVLQSFPSGGNELDDDVRAMSNFMALTETNPANADTNYFVYAPWPQLVDYDEWELNDIGNDANPRVRARRSYYELLTDTLAAERPGRVFMIPAGEVFFEVGQRIESGDLDGPASGFDLYRDHVHGSEIGRFIAATTVAATIARDNPIGWESVAGLPTISSDLSLDLQEIVWDVLVDRKRSGVSPVGDLNVDTTIDAADYETFVSRYSFRTKLSADANGDEVVDEADAQLLFSASAPGRADIDGDGHAAAADGVAWAAGYGQSGRARGRERGRRG